MDAREDADADQPEQEPSQPQPGDPFAWLKPHREQDDEDRHGCICDRGDARVDVLLAPRDQRERDRAVDDAEPEALPAEPSHVGYRRRRPSLSRQDSEDERRRDHEPEHDHRRRLEAANRHLDEHVRGAPEGGQRRDIRNVSS